MDKRMRKLQSQLNRIESEKRSEQVDAAKDVFLEIIANTEEERLPDVLSELAYFVGTDPSTLIPVVSGEVTDGSSVSVAEKPKFGFERLNECLQDACQAAGGEWKDPEGWKPPGCYYPDGTSAAEKAAISLAYGWGIAECEGRTIGGVIKGLIGLL